MKNGQLRSENDRVVSLVALVCMTIIMVGCIMGIVYLQEYGFYEKDNKGTTAKSVAVQLYSLDDVEKAKDYFLCLKGRESQYRIGYYEEFFTRKKSNFVFRVNSVLGDVLFDSLSSDSTNKTGLTFEGAKEATDYTGKSDFYILSDNGDFITLQIEYAILAPELQITTDRYSNAFQWIDTAYTLRYFVFIVLFVALAMIVILLSVFTINAGTVDEETGEIVPGFIDKLPLDFVTVFVISLFIVAGMIMGMTSAADSGMVLNNVIYIIIGVAAVLVVMSYLATFSVRVKMGKFYRNTVIYKIFKGFKRKTPRKVRRAIGELTLFRKIVLGVITFILFESIILAFTAYYGMLDTEAADPKLVLSIFLVGWAVTRLILIPIVVMIAINLHYVKEEGKRLAEGVMGEEIADKLSVAAIRTHGQNLDRIKKEINKAMEQELKSEKLKSELITNVSHDIKTPLTSIKNYVDFLNNDNLTDEERKNYVAIITKHTDKLSMLLNDLIEASKISSGNIEIELEKTCLNIVIEQTVEEFALKLEKSLLIPRVSMPMDDVCIMGDGKWLWRIFANLLNNACKYAAPETDLEITLERVGNKARVYICNISNSEFSVEGDELFERFVRGDSSRHTEGHGLGLSIAKSLAEMQGGTIDISVSGNKFSAILEFEIVE